MLFTGRFGFGRASFSEPTSERPSHDPSHRTAPLRLDVHAVAMVAPIGAIARGAQKPIGRPRSPPPVASAARRPTGRIGRLPGDSAVSVSTSAAVLVRARFLTLSERRTDRARWFRSAVPFLFHKEDRQDRRQRQCIPRRVCRFFDVMPIRGPSSGFDPHQIAALIRVAPVACPSTSHVAAANASVFFL